MSAHYMQNNVYKICTCDYVDMCGTADSLMLTQYVGTADSLMVTQYVGYSRKFNGDTICGVQQTV